MMRRIKDFRATFENKREIASNVFLIEFFLPDFDGSAEPGQFMMLKASSVYDPFLRRPYSIFDCEKERIKVLLKVIGPASSIIAEKQENEKIDILGPLGNGFPILSNKHSVLVAGGIGVAPLWFLAKKLKAENQTFSIIYGEKTATDMSFEIKETFADFSHIVTEDGSKGDKATAPGILPSFFDKLGEKQYVLYVCGPKAMLKETISFGRKRNIPVYVSLEQRMACGTGICFGCSVKTARKPGYLTICKDGPVFSAEDVEI